MLLRSVLRIATPIVGSALALAMAGCKTEGTFQCGGENDCSGRGVCEATGFCSFPDDGCESGRRYGEFAGSLSEQCVQTEDGTSGPSASTSTAASSTSSSVTTLPSTVGTTSSSGSPSSSGDETTIGVISASGSSGSGSTTAAVTTTGETSSSTTVGDGETSDTAADECTNEEFDAPPGPQWSVYGDMGAVSMSGGRLVINVDAGAPEAGMRSMLPANFTDAEARLEVVGVPGNSGITTSLVFERAEAPTEDSIAVVMQGGDVGYRTQEAGMASVTFLVAELELPATLRMKVDAEEIEMRVESGAAEIDVATVPTPDWMEASTVAVTVTNLSVDDPDGPALIESLEVCPAVPGP